jgi:hypothetical protein
VACGISAHEQQSSMAQRDLKSCDGEQVAQVGCSSGGKQRQVAVRLTGGPQWISIFKWIFKVHQKFHISKIENPYLPTFTNYANFLDMERTKGNNFPFVLHIKIKTNFELQIQEKLDFEFGWNFIGL